MQKAMTPVNSSKNDCLVDDAEKRQKKLTLSGRQCPLEDDGFATCSLPMTSVILEAVKKN